MTGIEQSRFHGADLAHAPDRDTAAAYRRIALVGGIVTAVWLAALLHWVLTDTVVPWDSKNQFYAFFRFLAASLHQGIAPFWNPYHYGGHPSAADPQSLVFAPAFVLWALFDAAPSIRAFDVIVFAHLLVGGLSVAAIGLRANWPAPASVLAAALYMLGGAAAGRLQHTGVILAYGLFAPSLLLLQVALQRRSLGYAAAFGAVAAMMALERNQGALLFCYILIAVAIAEVAAAERPLAYLRSRLTVFAAMGLIGFVLLIGPLLLTIQFAALSNRAPDLLNEALYGSFHPVNLATLGVADIFGSHGRYWGPDVRTVPDVAYTDDSLNYLFVGAVPVVLFVWLGIAGGAAWRRGRRMLTAALIVVLLYMLGRYTPVFPLMFQWVPGVSNFRRPVEGGFALTALIALLVGHFLADYVREGLPRGRPVRVAAAAAGAVAVVVWGAMFSQRFGHTAGALFAVLAAAPAFAAAIAVLAWPRTADGRMRAAVIVTAIAVTELIYWNVAFRLNAEFRKTYSALERPAGEDRRVVDLLTEAMRARHAQGERPRIEALGSGGPWQNLAMVQGFEATNGYNPMRIARYDTLVAPAQSSWVADMRDFPPSFPSYDSPLARLLGLEFIVLSEPIERLAKSKPVPDIDVLLAGPARWVYRLRHPAPRVAFAAGAETGVARITAWRPDRVAIETESAAGGRVVLRDSYYPGWYAEVDGYPVPIVRAEALFRGVDVPAGHHRVLFRFAPFAPENLWDALSGALGHKG